MITIRVNAPYTGWCFDDKDAILREEDGCPVEWIETDNKGLGYTFEEAYKALDEVIDEYGHDFGCFNYNDDDNVEFKEEYEKCIKQNPQMAIGGDGLEWYQGEGWYWDDGEGRPLVYKKGYDALRTDEVAIEIVEFVTYATNDVIKEVLNAYLDAESNDLEGLAECLNWIRWHNEEGRLRAITKGLYPWLDIAAENLERDE